MKESKAFIENEVPPSNWIKGTGRTVYHDPKTLINHTCWEGEQEQDPSWVKGRYNKGENKCQK